MSKLTIISSSDMIKILCNLGFYELRQNGSHKFFMHDDGRTATIPHHNKDLGRGLIRKILKDIQISVDEYERFQ